ncbi:MAG: DUF6105 family protein [Pseudomonadota bacterium]
MRAILILWAIPLVLFWGWYGLSAYNLHFGLFFLERQFHDLIFQIYSNILGLPAEDIPLWLAWVFFIDTMIILAIAALRWYKHWLPQTVKWLKEKSGLADEQRDYVQKIYEPLILNKHDETKPVANGPVPPAE